MRQRTNNHTSQVFCKDVAVSFARRRAELIKQANADGAKVLTDNGSFFHAERFDCCRSRIVYMACPSSDPRQAPSIVRRDGPVQYETMLLPKVAP